MKFQILAALAGCLPVWLSEGSIRYMVGASCFHDLRTLIHDNQIVEYRYMGVISYARTDRL